MDDRLKLRIKRALAIVTVLVIIGVFAFITYFFTVEFGNMKSAEDFKEYVDSFGIWGLLVGLGLQVLQVFVAIIPGEVVEVGVGFTYGAIGGTIICYAGLFIASSIVFLAVKKFGIRFVELFVSMDKINSLGFVKNNINNPSRLQKIAFILFFIPGTPKDLFTYFFGLTPMKYSEFMTVSLLARIPSVISSTVGGNLIASGNYFAAVVLFAATGIVSICGWVWYNAYSDKKNVFK